MLLRYILKLPGLSITDSSSSVAGCQGIHRLGDKVNAPPEKLLQGTRGSTAVIQLGGKHHSLELTSPRGSELCLHFKLHLRFR